MRQSLVVGNWKLNGDQQLVEQFAKRSAEFDQQSSSNLEVAICPPAVYLVSAVAQLSRSKIKVGVQNIAAQTNGAFTGEISSEMVAELGGRYAIIGHSERRELFFENSQNIAEKIDQAISQGIVPIFCCGEPLEVREAGNQAGFVEQQLRQVFAAISELAVGKIVIAYEPIWAIGTGKTASSGQVDEMHRHIREVFSDYGDAEALCILYGGSVKPENALELMSLQNVDGALVGGASLKVDDFLSIVSAAASAG